MYDITWMRNKRNKSYMKIRITKMKYSSWIRDECDTVRKDGHGILGVSKMHTGWVQKNDFCYFWLMVDGWGLMIDGWWLMVDWWWLVVQDDGWLKKNEHTVILREYRLTSILLGPLSVSIKPETCTMLIHPPWMIHLYAQSGSNSVWSTRI